MAKHVHIHLGHTPKGDGSAKFQQAQEAYRARRIDDAAFLAAKKKRDAAEKQTDTAEAAEKK